MSTLGQAQHQGLLFKKLCWERREYSRASSLKSSAGNIVSILGQARPQGLLFKKFCWERSDYSGASSSEGSAWNVHTVRYKRHSEGHSTRLPACQIETRCC